jgi:hypothetical protein
LTPSVSCAPPAWIRFAQFEERSPAPAGDRCANARGVASEARSTRCGRVARLRTTSRGRTT